MDGSIAGDTLLGKALGAAMVLGAACWLCLYPVLFVVSGLAVLLFTSQGAELLD